MKHPRPAFPIDRGEGIPRGGTVTGITSSGAALPQLSQGNAQSVPARSAGSATQLPSLTQQPAPINGAATTPSSEAAAGATGVQQPSAQIPDMSGLLGKARWLGPLMAVGGAGLALYALSKGRVAPVGGLAEGMKAPVNKLLLYGGVSTALSGLVTTGMGFKASGQTTGVATGRKQGIEELSAAVQQELVPTMQQLASENEQLKQALQAASAQHTGAEVAGTQGADMAGVDTQGGGLTGTGAQPASTNSTSGTAGQVSTGEQPQVATAIPAAQWSRGSIIGQSVSLGEVRAGSGGVIAEAGSYVVSQPLGQEQGYTSLAEADALARRGMTTELNGVKNYRWLVIEHGGRYFPFVAAKDQQGAPSLPPANGSVASWHAMRAIDDGTGNVQWLTYDWSKDGSSVVGVLGGGQDSSIGGNSANGSTSSSESSVIGGGGAQLAPRAASQIGRGFVVNDASIDGQRVVGGYLQLQALADTSIAGCDTPLEAAEAARLMRAADLSPSPYTRWVTVQIDDGKYYVYKASIVNRQVPELGGDAAPTHIFGAGFGEYFDGAAWQAMSDA